MINVTSVLSLFQSFPSVVVAYSLKAMKYRSKAATQQFPRLLQLVELYPETLENFKKKVSSRELC